MTGTCNREKHTVGNFFHQCVLATEFEGLSILLSVKLESDLVAGHGTSL